MLLHVIGGVEFGTGGGDLRCASLVVRSGEEILETCLSFLLCSEKFPGFSVIDKETGMINKLEGDVDYLFKDIGSVDGGGVVTAIFDPVEKRFDRLVHIVRGAKKQRRFPEDPRRRCWRRRRTSDPGWRGWW